MSSFVNGKDQQNSSNANVQLPSTTANMRNDAQHPPTHYLGANDREKTFTHEEWVQLRDKLFAFKQQKDTIMCEKAWSLNTSIRNPDRVPGFLKIISFI